MVYTYIFALVTFGKWSGVGVGKEEQSQTTVDKDIKREI